LFSAPRLLGFVRTQAAFFAKELGWRSRTGDRPKSESCTFLPALNDRGVLQELVYLATNGYFAANPTGRHQHTQYTLRDFYPSRLSCVPNDTTPPVLDVLVKEALPRFHSHHCLGNPCSVHMLFHPSPPKSSSKFTPAPGVKPILVVALFIWLQ